MTGTELKDKVLKEACNHCGEEWYCPSPCHFLQRAKTLSDKQWDDLAKKYVEKDDVDWSALSTSILRRTRKYGKELRERQNH